MPLGFYLRTKQTIAPKANGSRLRVPKKGQGHKLNPKVTKDKSGTLSGLKGLLREPKPKEKGIRAHTGSL